MIAETALDPAGTRWGSPTAHLLAACLVIVLWGGSYAVTRAAVQEIPPLLLAFLRFALASVLLWPVVRRRCPGVRLHRRDRWAAAGLGTTGVALYFVFENFGLKHTTASHGALIIATIPLVTAVAEALVRRHPLRPGTLAGLLVALVGVGVIVGGPGSGGASLLGDLLMLGAVGSWVAYTFIAHRLGTRYPNLWVTQAAMVGGTLVLAPLAAAEWAAVAPLPSPSPAAWGALLYLAVLCSALGYLLWNGAIPALGVGVTSNLIYGIPLVGVLSGVLFLGEPFTAGTAAGGALILAGVYGASRASRGGRPGGGKAGRP